MDAYLQSGGITGEEAGDAYQFHTSGIQDMVNNLKDKMSNERATVEKEEAEKNHAFQLLEQQLTMDTEAATDERDQKEELKAQRTEDSAAAKGDSTETTSTKEADEKYLAETTATKEA